MDINNLTNKYGFKKIKKTVTATTVQNYASLKSEGKTVST
jgi:hypothetical protein